MSQICQSIDTDHIGNINNVYYNGPNLVGYLCDNHRNNNAWCPVCKQFMRISEMYINTDIGIQICLPDALSQRSITLYTNKMNFALKSDINMTNASLNTTNQTVSNIQTQLNNLQTQLKTLKIIS